MRRGDRPGPIARIRAWWDARHPPADSLLLTQRNVYILPTRGGWLWALLVLMLLVGAINYQLNLGYLLCFVLAGVALVSMHSCHATLRGLRLQLAAPEPVHAGHSADLMVSLKAERGSRGARYGIGIRLEWPVAASLATAHPTSAWTWLDIAATASTGLYGTGGAGQAPATVVHLALPCPERGWQDLPRLALETRFPFGLFRAWTVWRPAARVLIWPAPEMPTPPWPTRPHDTGTPPALDRPAAKISTNPLDADSARPYRAGDSPRDVLWKKSASAIASGAEPALVSRTGSAAAPQTCLDFDWQDAAQARDAGADARGEARLSRLTAWVLAANRAELAWTLRLPGRVLARGSGAAHRRACLDALAQIDLASIRRSGAAGVLDLAAAPAASSAATSADGTPQLVP